MTWLTPLSGLLLAAAVIPPLVLLYFLKLRRKPAPIASTLLWKRSVEDLRANAPFQRLRLSLLLFLQLLALVLVVLAIMQPQADTGQKDGGRLVLLIDNSASMNAIDGGEAGGEARTRLERAKELAAARVERLFGTGLFGGAPSQVMVIAFNERAEVRTPFSDSRPQILQAIEGIEPTDAPTALAEALQLARAFTTTVNPDDTTRPIEAPAGLELYSDGRIRDLDIEVLKPGESISYTVVGRAESVNVGLIGLAAERPYDKPGQIQVFTAVANFSPEPLNCDVQLSVNGTVQAITPKPLLLPAATVDPETKAFKPGLEQVAFQPFEQPRGAVIEIAALHEDMLPADNVANIVVPPARRLRVALVDAEGFFFTELLEGLKLTMVSEVTLLTGAEFETLASEGAIDTFDVVVIDDFAPAALPAGRFLSFGATPPLAGLNEFGVRERVFVRSMREDHPLFRLVNFDDLFIGTMKALAPAPEIEILAEAPEGPVVLSAASGPTQLVHVTFNPLDSNGPFGRSLVNFVCNAIEWLGTSRDSVATGGLKPGQALTTRLPATASNVRVRLPDQTDVSIASVSPEFFSWGPIKRIGLYEVSWDQEGADGVRQTRAFAANLLDAEEGRIEPRAELALGTEKVSGRLADDGLQTPLWPWALGACLLVLMAEWWVYVRRTGV